MVTASSPALPIPICSARRAISCGMSASILASFCMSRASWFSVVRFGMRRPHDGACGPAQDNRWRPA